jgi:hypothetical protein
MLKTSNNLQFGVQGVYYTPQPYIYVSSQWVVMAPDCSRNSLVRVCEWERESAEHGTSRSSRASLCSIWVCTIMLAHLPFLHPFLPSFSKFCFGFSCPKPLLYLLALLFWLQLFYSTTTVISSWNPCFSALLKEKSTHPGRVTNAEDCPAAPGTHAPG